MQSVVRTFVLCVLSTPQRMGLCGCEMKACEQTVEAQGRGPCRSAVARRSCGFMLLSPS